jgi:hypothetical protein
MPQQQRVGRDESARLFRTSGRVTRSCCPAWCARSLGRERVASTAVLTAGVDDPGITVIIARRALLARPGQRVRHRLTPTRRGSVAAHPCRHRPHRGCTDRLVGARRCLARRASRRGKHPWHASTTSPTDPPPCPSPHHGVPGPTGRTGQAPPDPYRTGECTTHPQQVQIPPRTYRPSPVGARRCLARRAVGAATSVPATIPGGLRTPPWAPVRAAGSGPAGPAGQASPPGKSAHLGGARRRVACRTSVARQMGRHISDDADQCAAQPPHHRLPGPRSRGPHGVGDRAGRKLPGSFPEPASAGCRTAPLGGESASARCAG